MSKSKADAAKPKGAKAKAAARAGKAKAKGTKAAPAGARGNGGSQPYVVLARKYRPQTFSELIGQEAMVTTLRNAFASGRIAQAYMLTGVRGVGKTTTARILARALNYVPLDKKDAPPEAQGGPTVDMPELGVHCAEIMESRHPDVLEMDAASNTGVDNIRELIENARYRPIAARMKVYIIDEVHMLSKGAFNALLKTLEEPPEHVKFIFATTEVRKVPVTVLSRCQRFDLKRVDADVLVAHFQRIAEAEGVRGEEEAFRLIARAAEGSVRDGLSILDQAIAQSGGQGKAVLDTETVRAMLGLADRGRVFDLLEAVFAGDAKLALERLGALHGDGADPVQILRDMAEAVHLVTRIKVAGAQTGTEALAADERRRAESFGKTLSMPTLARAWQMLLKGLEEAAGAPNRLAAAEMLVIRLAYVAELPTPGDIARALAGEASAADGAPAPGAPPGPAPAPHNGPAGRGGAGRAGAASPAPEAPQPASFEELVALAGEKRDIRLKVALETQVRLVRFRPGDLEISLTEGASTDLVGELSRKLSDWTGRRWMVALSREPGAPTLEEQARARAAAEIAAIEDHPLVRAALETFPDAEITEVRPTGADAGTGRDTGEGAGEAPASGESAKDAERRKGETTGETGT